MRLPRDVSGTDLARGLAAFGYQVTRQTGSHLRLTRPGPPERHLTIPVHAALRVGTLGGILAEVASHLGRAKEDVAMELFDGQDTRGHGSYLPPVSERVPFA